MAETIIRVSPWHLRRLLKKGNFLAKIQSGQLVEHLIRNNHLCREKAHKMSQPYCTHSQTVNYLDGNIRVATVHQYLRPDGITLGGSGMPDPKYLEFEGTQYAGWRRDKWYVKIWYWGIGWIAGIRYKMFG